MNFSIKSSRLAIVIGIAAIALVVAGCSSGSDNASDHNKQDVSFAKEMIPHHAQAVEMAGLAETRAANSQVKELAVKIKGAQQPEIDQMNGWLRNWGEPEINTSDAAGGMDHGSMNHGSSMGGMMSPEAMNQLSAASGAEFDRLFLQGMIEHHNGAIAMAKSEQAEGQFAAAKTLADSIISSQQSEIDQMKQLLG